MTDAAAEGVRRSLEGWKRSLRWVVALLAAVSLLALSYGPLLRALGGALVAEDPLRPAGAIVVLGGEIPFRAVEAAQLYRKKWAPRVVLTRGVDWEGQTKLKELGIEYPAYWEINREILLRLKVLQNAIVICEGGGGWDT